MLPVCQRFLGDTTGNNVRFEEGSDGITERRAQLQPLGSWKRLYYNGASLIFKKALKTIGLEGKCLNFLVLE